LMNDGDNAAKGGGYQWLNFSSAKSQNSKNAHFRVFGKSIWETLVSDPSNDPKEGAAAGEVHGRKSFPELVAVAPKAGELPRVELDTPEGKTHAESALKISWKRGSSSNATTRRARAENDVLSQKIASVRQVLIDVSEGVSSTVLADIKSSVTQMINNAEEGDVIGIQMFSKDMTEIAPLTVILGESERNTLISTLEKIKSESELPYLNDALQKTLANLLNANTGDDYISSIFLFANGYNASNSFSAFNSIEKAEIPTYIFHTSQSWSSETVLRKLAKETEGSYYDANDSSELSELIWDAEIDSSPVVDIEVNTASKQIDINETLSLYVDDNLGEIEITLDYSGNVKNLTMEMISPDGTTNSLTTEDYCEEYSEDGYTDNFCFIDFPSLSTGLWQLRLINAIKADDDEDNYLFYNVNAYPADNHEVIFAGVNPRGGNYLIEKGQPLIIEASVASDLKITGIDIRGELETPDGSQIAFTLNDEGVAPDSKSQDGIYTASLDAPDVGDYGVTVWFDNSANTGSFTNKGPLYARFTPDTKLIPVNQAFTRSAFTAMTVREKHADYDRIMDWLEIVQSNIYPTIGVSYLGLTDGYNAVRHYIKSDWALGELNGVIYKRDPQTEQIIPVGSIVDLLPSAEEAGF
ncbi:MAG: VWA domain-containing protein, partial [Thiotrichaceae bacterium]|nr:VWA domain-containing protein [Thiotrichaceae bacterium]